MDATLILATHKETKYKIIHAANADPTSVYAAKELSAHLEKMTGAAFEILTDESPRGEFEIHVGQSGRTKELDLDFAALGDEGYFVKTMGNDLLLAGNTGRANAYAVYDLLEESFGCRQFTADMAKVPKTDVLMLLRTDRKKVPILEYRDTSFRETMNETFALRKRINGTYALTAEYGGYIHPGGGHTFNRLVPVDKYFETHPEYFSEIDGVRQSGNGNIQHTQLCLTNPDVLKIATEEALQWLKDNPHTNIVSVSQNDSDTPCRCAECQKVDLEEGSHAGTLLRFVNAVAEEVEKHFPKGLVSTLAYRFTRKAPAFTKPRHNVLTRMCSIECCFTHPIGTCEMEEGIVRADGGRTAGSFAKDLEDWNKICKRIYVWDYLTNFPFYLVPYSNIEVIGDNIKYFVKNNVKGIYAQGATNTLGAFASDLKAYIAAHCLWNPDADAEVLKEEFITHVYGKAAPVVTELLERYKEQTLKEDTHLHFDIHIDRLFNEEGFLESLEPLWDEAEALAEDEQRLKMVKKLRLAQRFTTLVKFGDHKTQKDQEAMDKLAADAKALGMTRFDELHDMDRWVERWKRSRFG